LRLSIIVPFHKNLDHLTACLASLARLRPEPEIIVVADAARDDCHALVARHRARLLEIDGPSGPSVARNRGAAIASGDLLVFVDADVVAPPESLAELDSLFTRDSRVDAAFGAYDETPLAPNFISQYKNLAHSYIHQSANRVAQTFWAGFGAVRASAFRAIGGFDERFVRPSVEDIDLGYRLTAAGHLVILDHELRVQHLKRWTFRSLIESDIRDRGIPWTQLILRSQRAHDDLNLRSGYRVSVVLAYLVALGATLALMDARALLVAAGAAVAMLPLNAPVYRFFVQRRGVLFALRVAPLHFLYHLYNGFSFVVGSALYLAARHLGLRLPGALPLEPWPSVASAVAPRTGTEVRDSVQVD
jgi:GT2 family glycosyltransferase